MATAPHLLDPLPKLSGAVAAWVDSVRQLTESKAVHWCEGSEAGIRDSTARLVRDAERTVLNSQTFPGCYLARSHPSDVARVEHLTYICTSSKEDAGPNNSWMSPEDAHAKMNSLFRGCKIGRAHV